MCGIVGYIGNRQDSSIILDGLRRLEYRGYDSAGMALCGEGGLQTVKKAGRIDNLRIAVEEAKPEGTMGISHTRWATHGPATDENAHPHPDQGGKLVLDGAFGIPDETPVANVRAMFAAARRYAG